MRALVIATCLFTFAVLAPALRGSTVGPVQGPPSLPPVTLQPEQGSGTGGADALPTVCRGRKVACRTIQKVFKGSAWQAIRVAWCESRLNNRAVSRTGDYGLFQINRAAHRNWVDFGPRIFNPVYNSRVAYRLSRSGTSWQPWSWSRRCWA